MRVYLGADHAGTALKEKIKRELLKDGFKVKDLSFSTPQGGDDYPDYAFEVAEAVTKDKEGYGVLVCDTGIGMAIAANKVEGVYAALVHTKFAARRSREHNNANVIVLSSEDNDHASAIEMIKVFLNTPFSGADRHTRRIAKIKYYENHKQAPNK